MMYELPTLYKKASGGHLQEWSIRVEGNKIITTYGQQGGKMVTTEKVIKEGKNLGQANATDAEEQARSEATSKWTKQKDKGYFETPEDAETTIVIRPMKALDFRKRKHNIVYPAVGQFKFDGVRCVAIHKKGDVLLTSTNGKEFPCLEHIKEQLKVVFKSMHVDILPDGELFSDLMPFERVVGLVKKGNLNDRDREDQLKISMRIYDSYIPSDPELGFLKRYNVIGFPVLEAQQPGLIMVHNFTLREEADVYALNEKAVAEGHEGAMVRNIEGVYGLNKRVKDLQKYKSFEEEEFVITGFREAEGKDAGTVVWICATKDGKTFEARPRGDWETRKFWFEHGTMYVGKLLTVRFQNYTKYGIPRFPVGKSIRDYE